MCISCIVCVAQVREVRVHLNDSAKFNFYIMIGLNFVLKFCG